jgi:rubrerythrin
MYEYIKRTDAVAEVNRGDLLVGNNAEWAREIIWRTPYADVREVKHEQWHKNVRYFGNVKVVTYTCSGCGHGVDHTSRFCPECGATMNKENYYERIH